jgi:acyl-CoA dehydrogenase
VTDVAPISFALSDEQLELQALARTFARDEVRPRARELDRVVDPSENFPFDLIRRASELGLRTITLPREFGGRAADALTQAIVLEEICVGDVGFGMALLHPWREGLALATATTAEQRDRYLPEFLADPEYVTSLGMTESHAGSDHVMPYVGDISAGTATSAVLEGDEWVINGHKRWISNAGISKMLFLLARTDPTVPWNEGVSLFLVPTDTPGYRIGQIEDKFGIRVNRNAEILFDNVRIPATNLIGEVNGGAATLAKLAKGSLFKEGVKCLGIARAAYEEAVSWTSNRIQGGRRIIDHESVRVTLADMAIKIETSRSIVLRTAWAVDHDPVAAAMLEPMTKIYAGEAAAQVALAALDLHGAYGVSRDLHIEKLVRDAASMLHAFGGNHALRARLAATLVP